MIFLMATFWLVSWSFAELNGGYPSSAPNPTQHKRQGPRHIPNQSKCAHANGLEVGIPICGISQLILLNNASRLSYLEVISKVVPKIWARTNSAMASDLMTEVLH